MGIIKKQAFQSSVLLYLGVIIGFLTTGLLAPNLLTKSEIGTLRLLLSYSAIFMSLGILGFSTTTIRFLPQFLNKKGVNHHGFLGISLLVGTVGFLITLACVFAIKPYIIHNNIDKSLQFAQYFIFIIPLIFFQVYYTLFDSYNTALYRSAYGVFLRDFVQRILVLIGLLLVLFHYFNFEQYIYFWVAAICFPTILIFFHLVKHKAFDIKINWKQLSKPLIASMASVSLFGLLNSFGTIAMLQIDAIMVNMFMDASAVGIYVTTFYFGTLVLIPSKALNKIAPSLIVKAYKENDLDTVKDIYYKSSSSLFLIGVLILLGLMVNLDNIFNIIPRSYEEGKDVIVLIGLANLVKMAGGGNDSLITYSQYYKMTTVFLIVLVILIIILNFIFIPIYGMTGAAFASLLSIFIHNLIKFIFIKIKFGFNPYNFQYIAVIGIAILAYFILQFLPEISNFIVEILIDSIIVTILFYIPVRFLPISSEINNSIQQIINKVRTGIDGKIE